MSPLRKFLVTYLYKPGYNFYHKDTLGGDGPNDTSIKLFNFSLLFIFVYGLTFLITHFLLVYFLLLIISYNKKEFNASAPKLISLGAIRQRIL